MSRKARDDRAANGRGSIRDRLRMWWLGEYVPHRTDPGSGLVFLSGNYRRHWSARYAAAALQYLRDNHRWIIGTLVAVAGVLVVLGSR
jgi:hypothetical protein